MADSNEDADDDADEPGASGGSGSSDSGGSGGAKSSASQKHKPVDPKEEALVKKRWKEYERARKFDEPFRKQIAIDRRYATGKALLNWAVTANNIGAFIDILTSLLYARDPDVSVRKAPQVNNLNEPPPGAPPLPPPGPPPGGAPPTPGGPLPAVAGPPLSAGAPPGLPPGPLPPPPMGGASPPGLPTESALPPGVLPTGLPPPPPGAASPPPPPDAIAELFGPTPPSAIDIEQFAQTLEIVISRLWRDARLKLRCRKMVRSILSVGEGWIKCTMVAEKTPMPEVETALNDARETMARLHAQQDLLEEAEGDPEAIDAELDEKEQLISELKEKIEVAIKRMFVVDFVKAESIQVSLDVDSITDYLDANWVANEIFVEKDDALERFKDLNVEDLEGAMLYYQMQPKSTTSHDGDDIKPQGQVTAEMAQNYSTHGGDGGEETPFYRVVEQWDRRDKKIRTMIEGVKRWAKQPYDPPYPTSRFYCYFYVGFFEVDGERHAQSLSGRLANLQDEFSNTRSNFRRTRERSIPNTLFNATMLDDIEADKIRKGTEQEMIPLRPNDPATPLANLFAAKPVSAIDPRVYDTGPIMSDMERISGVQEALQSAVQGSGAPKTATEANIEQSGTSARTTADRDFMEWMLADLAQYTTEQALQSLPVRAAMRMAGPAAIWPFGLDIEDLFTLVDINIQAGSTGKPRAQADQSAWATILPLIEKLLGQIEQARAMGNIPLANALTELVKETMLRMGDTTDCERFIPQIPPPGSPASGMPPRAPPADVKVQLKGVLDPATSLALVQPTVKMDDNTMQMLSAPPPGAPGGPGGPAPNPGSPAGPVAPPAGVPPPATVPT